MNEPTRRGEQPVRPESEYGDRPAGATGPRPEGADVPSARDEVDERAQIILGALKREGEAGEPALAREAGLEIQEINPILMELQRAGRISRTADGSWQLTPATAAITEPRPSSKEPSQGPGGGGETT